MSGLVGGTFRSIYQLAYELSPIVLTGGLAAPIGGLLPIVALTQATDLALGLLSGNFDVDPDQFFARFMPVPGSSLIDNEIGHYPFANQAIAANAIITQPLAVSLRMVAPAREPGAYVSKLATITALKTALELHSNTGGTFTVLTPAYIWTNCILRRLHDVSSGEGKQVQTTWQFDFEQPLLTQAQADAVLGNLMNKLENGLPTDGSLSGASVVPNNPFSGALGSVLPSLSSIFSPSGPLQSLTKLVG